MEILSGLPSKKRTKSDTEKKRETLNAIRKNLDEYSSKHITIRDCLSKTGALTADLIMYHNSDVKVPKNVYDAIMVMIMNYYAMVYLDMYTGFYTVNKDYVYHQVISLSEDSLNDAMRNKALTSEKNLAVQTSKDFNRQLVDMYYRSGTEGCLSHLITSVLNLLQSVNRNATIDKSRIENVMVTIQAERVLQLG